MVQEGQSVAFMLELIGTALVDTEVEFTTADMSATGKYTSIIIATNLKFVCLSVRVGGHGKTILYHRVYKPIWYKHLYSEATLSTLIRKSHFL